MPAPEGPNPFFDHPILNSPYEYPTRHWELDDDGQPTQRIIASRRRAEFITPIPKPKKREERRPPSSEIVFDEGQGPFDEGAAIRPDLDHQRGAAAGGSVAGAAQPESVAGHARDRASAPALAAPRVQRHPPVLLSGRGGRDGDLADRGRAAIAGSGQATPRPPRERQQGRQPGVDAPRAEARHRRRQDDRHGDAHRVADDQRRAAARAASSSRAAFSSSRPASRSRTACASSSRTIPTATTPSRELVPGDMLDDVNGAKIVITNYHAFKLRERIELSEGRRALLQGRTATS